MPDTHVLVESFGQDRVADYDAIVIGAGISGIFMALIPLSVDTVPT